MLQVFLKQQDIKNWQFKLILYSKIADLHTKIVYRAQGSTMMGPGLKVALWHWLIRGKGQLFAKIRENQLQALKVWEKT